MIDDELSNYKIMPAFFERNCMLSDSCWVSCDV